jgi:hypothetical protein
MFLSFVPHLSRCVVASLSSLPCFTTSLCYLHFLHCLASLPRYAELLPHLIASSSHLVVPHIASLYLVASHCLVALLCRAALLPCCLTTLLPHVTSLPSCLALPCYHCTSCTSEPSPFVGSLPCCLAPCHFACLVVLYLGLDGLPSSFFFCKEELRVTSFPIARNKVKCKVIFFFLLFVFCLILVFLILNSCYMFVQNCNLFVCLCVGYT